MDLRGYLMESNEESIRLDLKTDGALVEKQALWAGIRPGMRVADLGCGSGKTTFHLNKLVQPSGWTVGVDVAQQRIHYAESHIAMRELNIFAKISANRWKILGCSILYGYVLCSNIIV